MDLSSVKVGFIGAGNMAQAMAKGIMSADLLKSEQLWASAPSDGTLDVWQTWGCHTVNDNNIIFDTCEIIILAVKPHLFSTVVNGLRPVLKDESDPTRLVMSVMAGITISTIEELLCGKRRNLEAVIRVVPNTPALVGAGCSVFSVNKHVSEEHTEIAKKILESVGIVHQVGEYQLNAFTGLSGSGPAYVYMAIEALSDGAVKMGIPRPLATQFAAQMVYGSAKMVLDTKRHPGQLKDDVCSPGGTTIAGVHALEKAGFRSAFMDAVEASTKRAEELSKSS